MEVMRVNEPWIYFEGKGNRICSWIRSGMRKRRIKDDSKVFNIDLSYMETGKTAGGAGLGGARGVRNPTEILLISKLKHQKGR